MTRCCHNCMRVIMRGSFRGTVEILNLSIEKIKKRKNFSKRGNNLSPRQGFGCFELASSSSSIPKSIIFTHLPSPLRGSMILSVPEILEKKFVKEVKRFLLLARKRVKHNWRNAFQVFQRLQIYLSKCNNPAAWKDTLQCVRISSLQRYTLVQEMK